MFQLLGKLYEANLSTPLGFFRLVTSVLLSGVNLMALLRFTARTYPEREAIADEEGGCTYAELYLETQQLTINLQEKHQLKAGKKVALVCRNHASLVKSLFALSQLGADIYLLNAEMSDTQFNSLLNKHDFDCIIYDIEVWKMIHQSGFDKTRLLSYHLTLPAIDDLSKRPPTKGVKIKKSSAGKLIILTGGTTGDFKTAVRKPSIFTFLHPFFALLTELDIAKYRRVYIATPIYHGFGLAALIISILLGTKMMLLKRFEIQKANTLMLRHQIQVIILVPLMLSRLIKRSHLELVYLRQIISGGAALNPSLVEETFNKIGPRLANLYGTSEAGFCIMASPSDLKYHPNTIGKKIAGVQTKIIDQNNNMVSTGEVGRLYVKSKWTMKNSQEAWIDTGDLAYVDENGYYFLCGRIDDMIVSAGENVYPVELENILIKHPAISQVAVIGIPDEEFGQRLKAFVVLKKDSPLTEAALKAWLKEEAARYQQPKSIAFVAEIPVTALGKPDKKVLV